LSFLFDENLSQAIVIALRAHGEPLHHVRELFPASTPDETLFRFLADRAWCLVSRDLRITRNPQQRHAILEAGIGAFFFTGRASRSAFKMTMFVFERWEEIKAFADAERRPFICAVPDRGRLHRLDG
jgi:hypothetical protein